SGIGVEVKYSNRPARVARNARFRKIRGSNFADVASFFKDEVISQIPRENVRRKYGKLKIAA
ncbi:MAG TPA: hypothetical protein O0X38_06355, partial [Methanocorpusculum sp.]|nr:hypothetical protein [Methanocorpusculum sp.]